MSIAFSIKRRMRLTVDDIPAIYMHRSVLTCLYNRRATHNCEKDQYKSQTLKNLYVHLSCVVSDESAAVVLNNRR